jgi:hypothetical protein
MWIPLVTLVFCGLIIFWACLGVAWETLQETRQRLATHREVDRILAEDAQHSKDEARRLHLIMEASSRRVH